MTNDNLPRGVVESLDYLRTGGLGEVIGLTSLAREMGEPKVQSDTDMATALCILAAKGIEAERCPHQVRGRRTVSDIPEDVVKAAMSIYVAYVEDNGLRIDADPTEAELLEVTARAIMAERERCAAICDDSGILLPKMSSVSYDKALTARDLASAIRSPRP